MMAVAAARRRCRRQPDAPMAPLRDRVDQRLSSAHPSLAAAAPDLPAILCGLSGD